MLTLCRIFTVCVLTCTQVVKEEKENIKCTLLVASLFEERGGHIILNNCCAKHSRRRWGEKRTINNTRMFDNHDEGLLAETKAPNEFKWQSEKIGKARKFWKFI